MCGMLASLCIMFWIVTGAQVAIYNDEMMFVEKNVSTAGCPADVTVKNHTELTG